MQDKIIQAFQEFGVDISISEVVDAPQMTRYAVVLGHKYNRKGEIVGRTKVKDVVSVANDVSAILCTKCTVSVSDSLVWVEIPKLVRATIKKVPRPSTSRAFIGIGSDTRGRPVGIDLNDPNTPHLLVSGQTGSGKSTSVNFMISYIMENYPPYEIALILIDLKKVEFAAYRNAEHVSWPVANDGKTAAAYLNKLLYIANERYSEMQAKGVRRFEDTNETRIVCFIDEYAELVLSTPEIERVVTRIAAIGRAAGIHLIIATQHPTVKIISGAIKANFPTRLTFRVVSTSASMVAMDSPDAKHLLGKGDAILSGHGGIDVRVQGAYLTDDEIEAIVASHSVQQKKKGWLSSFLDGANTPAPATAPLPKIEWGEFFDGVAILVVCAVKFVLLVIGSVLYLIAKFLWWVLRVIVIATCTPFMSKPKARRFEKAVLKATF